MEEEALNEKSKSTLLSKSTICRLTIMEIDGVKSELGRPAAG